jgi:dolichol kinase
VIHLFSLSIPIFYYFNSSDLLLKILIPLAIISVVIDLLSQYWAKFHHLFFVFFGAMMRPHETRKGIHLNGASWVFISAIITIILFPKLIAISAFSILIISDLLAALIGRKFGRHPLFDKSWEGTFAFIISGLLIVFLISSLENQDANFLLACFAGVIVSAFSEAASGVLKLDDNLAVPLAFGFAHQLSFYLLT